MMQKHIVHNLQAKKNLQSINKARTQALLYRVIVSYENSGLTYLEYTRIFFIIKSTDRNTMLYFSMVNTSLKGKLEM